MLVGLGALTLVLSWLAKRALENKLKVQPCEHEVTSYSWTVGTTRCLICGEVLDG